MDYLTISLLFSFLLTFIYAVTISGRRNSRLPPGPFPFPIIGSLLLLGDKPHQSLAKLSRSYGPLMSLKLGSITTIVVSSPDMAKEFFQTHDQSFSGRPLLEATRTVDHNKYSMVFLPAGDQWRKLRRISREYVFSMQRLDAGEHLRQEKIRELLEHVNRCCTSESVVNIGEIAFTTSVNFLSNFLFSTDLAQYDSMASQEFKDSVWALMELAGKPNTADLFPILKPFDLQGILRHGTVYAKKIMTIFDRIIDQRLLTRSSSSVTLPNNDVLDSLLNLKQKDASELDINGMRHLFMSLFMGGTDTTSSTLEWAMAELIHNPEKMEKTRSEVNELMKNNNKNIIKESDISQLPYLQAVIKETFRLHPPVPFLVPHQAICDVEVQGFMVPKNAQIFCNVWAMGRDPKVWSDPETFMPERFLEVKTDYKGQDFEFIPFGAGRRMCPALNIAHRMLHVMLGTLIQKFDWKLEGNMRAQDLDMSDKFGLTLQRSTPLKAIPLKLQ